MHPKRPNIGLKKLKLMKNEQMIWGLLDKIPNEFITEPAKEFAMALLIENVKLLSENKYE
jgi:hypothetical protein